MGLSDTLLPLAGLAIATTLVGKLLYETLWSPLSHIPGPLLARLTQYYIILIDLTGKRANHIHHLHQRYGLVVRVAPDEVSFSSPAAAREIYNYGAPYLKSSWYEYFGRPPFGIFQLVDKKQHAARKKLLAPAFSLSALYDVEPTVHKLVLRLADKIKHNSRKGQPIDVLSYFRCISVDVVGELFLGQSFDALEAEGKPDYLKWMDDQNVVFGMEYAFPPVIKLLRLLPFERVVDFLRGADKVCEFAEDRFAEYLSKNGRKSTRRDLLTRFLAANEEAEKAGEPVLSDVRIVREVGNMVSAGTDTTSITLTYLFWELAKNPDWQDRVREEIAAKAKHAHGPPKFSQLSDLPILSAVVNESLRMHAAAPSSLFRVVPKGGRTIDDCFLPEKTVIGVQCHTTHRDEMAFPKPEVWDPTRWLGKEGEGALSTRAKDLFLPFSRGPRSCIGQNIAMMELKVITAVLVQAMRWKPAQNTTEDSMKMLVFFLGTPRAGRCDLVFESLAE